MLHGGIDVMFIQQDASTCLHQDVWSLLPNYMDCTQSYILLNVTNQHLNPEGRENTSIIPVFNAANQTFEGAHLFP